jgi:hypothetical protein
MIESWNRRRVLKQLAIASAALALPADKVFATAATNTANQDLEVQISKVSAHTVRLSVLPIQHGKTAEIPYFGSLIRESWDSQVTRLHSKDTGQTIQSGELKVRVSLEPISVAISSADGGDVQTLAVDRATGVVSFATGDSPLLGLGEGGPQFDRRGSVHDMKNGQGGYKLETHGARVGIPWIIGTAGWAIFFHQPFGTFDFTSSQSRFSPANADNPIQPRLWPSTPA